MSDMTVDKSSSEALVVTPKPSPIDFEKSFNDIFKDDKAIITEDS